MKHIINKLSALIMMLMCVSATMQAEIVHHTVCDPTPTSRGFTRECWEDTNTGKIYADAARTQELVDYALAKAVTYAKLSENPVTGTQDFSVTEHDFLDNVIDGVTLNLDFNWSVSTTYQTNSDNTTRYAQFTVKGNDVRNARIVWFRDNKFVAYGKYTVEISVNGTVKYNRNQNNGEEIEGAFVVSLPNLKDGDVVRFAVTKTEQGSWAGGPTFKATFEYTSLPSNIMHHMPCEPTLSSRGFTLECWENTETGKFYADAARTQEIKDSALAKAVIYAKLPASPIVETDRFNQSEHENDWDVDLNWAGVTTYSYYDGNETALRWVKFATVTEEAQVITNARLVWNRNHKHYSNGYYIVRVYVNDVLVFSRDQKQYGSYEGVFVLPLPGLKKGDVVKFEVTQTSRVYSSAGTPTFKASLEYNIIPCQHEYPEGSAICSNCGYVKPHDHTYDSEHLCTQCVAPDPAYIVMFGYLGEEKNIMWILSPDNVVTYKGTGEMESFKAENNAWRIHKSEVCKVVIGEGITKIGDGNDNDAAYFSFMSNLREISLPSTLKVIGNFAFNFTSALTSITLPEGLQAIGFRSFQACRLGEIVIPASVESIGPRAFFLNRSKSITLKGAPTSIAEEAFRMFEGLKDFYLMSGTELSVASNIFGDDKIANATLHVNNAVNDWANTTSPWKGFGKIVPLTPFNVEYKGDEDSYLRGWTFDTEATNNSWTLKDGGSVFAVNEDVPMQTLTYTRNFTAANQWQSLCVPFEMELSDWADKFDVAAINNFHEYTNQNGEMEKIELEVRYVKAGKLLPNIPYLIRAKEAGEHTLTLNNVTLHKTAVQSISCSSTERKYTFTGTYDAINGLQTKDYIFVSDGRLCKADNDTDVLNPMRWYLTIEDRERMTYSPAAALSKPMDIRVIGDEDDLTGVEEMTVVSTPMESVASGIYNVSGVQFAKPQQGINIINGKKILVK